MLSYTSGDASRAARGMVVFDQNAKKIVKKAKKLEMKHEKAVKNGDLLGAGRIRRGYMNLAKKYPNLVK